jgi:hypothetical protein
LGRDIFLGCAQGGMRYVDVWVGRKCALNEAIKVGRTKSRPPVRLNLGALNQSLATRDLRIPVAGL